MSELTPDLAIIGGGAAGLSVAAGAAQMGASVVLIERGAMGGECLNVGCVPSKALIAAARAASGASEAARLGVRATPEIDFPAVMAHVKASIAAIAPHDSQARFEGLGVTVLRETARFAGPEEIVAGASRIRFRRAVVATGSRPAIPPIPGLERAPYLTNETIFDLDALPRRLLVLGGGAIGVELGQAFRALGSEVALIDRAPILAREDAEAVALIRDQLRADGVALHEEAGVAAVSAAEDSVSMTLDNGVVLTGSHLLVATGRQPGLDALELDAAGVQSERDGVVVDSALRTSNRRVFAIGDCAAGLPRLTHSAGAQAGVVIRRALFRLPARFNPDTLPRAVYCTPELAQIGPTALADAQEWRAPFAKNDRAIAEDDRTGFVKILADKAGRARAATIVGAEAGALIAPLAAAVSRGEKLSRIAGQTLPYPTRPEAVKAAAAARYAEKLYSPLMRRVVGLLGRLG